MACQDSPEWQWARRFPLPNLTEILDFGESLLLPGEPALVNTYTKISVSGSEGRHDLREGHLPESPFSRME